MSRRGGGWSPRAQSGLLVAVLGVGMVGTALAGPPAGSRWIGADALIYAEVTDSARLIDRVGGEPVQGLLASLPGYAQAFDNEGYRKFRAAADLIARRLDRTPEALLRELTAGGLVAAVEAPDGKAPRPVLIVTPSTPEQLRRASDALLELARQDAVAKGQPDPVKSAEYRGVTSYVLGPKAAYAVVGGCLVIGEPDEGIRAVIDRSLDDPSGGRGIAARDDWRARREAVGPGAVAFGFARLERLRQIDPKKFGFGTVPPQATFLFGSWVEALKTAPWISAELGWDEGKLRAELTLPTPPGGYPERVKGFVPGKGRGAPALLAPPGTIATLSLWRDLSAVWEARAELFSAQEVQNLAGLDTFAGQFFGGRDFGSGVLGAFGRDWRLVVALQDFAAMKPQPDLKLPAFALVADLNPGDEAFAQRLIAAFQSFVGLMNLDAAQKKAPPLMLGSETFEGVTISTTRYLPDGPAPAQGPGNPAPVHRRFNYSPSAALAGGHFILSSSVGLTRDLIRTLGAPSGAGDATLALEADGAALARLVEINRERLVMQNMLEKGHDRPRAEAEVAGFAKILRFLGHGRLTVRDGSDMVRVGLGFSLGEARAPSGERGAQR